MIFGSLGNSALNARPYSITGQQITQPSYAQGRFGVVLGGPLMIPKVFKDSSTFFSLNYFGTRASNPFSATTTVPTAAARTGDFSGLAQTIHDPATGQPFAGNLVPVSRMSTVARGLLQYIPLPNQPGAVNNFVYQSRIAQNSDNLSARVQRSVSRRDRLAVQFNMQRRDGDQAQPFGYVDVTGGSGMNLNVSWTHNLSPMLINTARVTFNRNTNHTDPFFAFGRDVASALGIQGASTDPKNFGPPNLNFTNFGALSDGAPSDIRNRALGFSESLLVVRGSHSISFGVNFNRTNLNRVTDPNGRGTFNFTGIATSLVGSDGRPAANTGFDFADYLLGLPQSSSIRYGDASTYFRQNTLNGFAQDDWKVRPSLSLTLGVRYEYFSPMTEKYGRMANLDIAPGFTGVAVVTPGGTSPYSGAVPDGLIHPDYNNISPRLGLAWRVPHLKRSTIVRGGYGIYYNGQAYNQFSGRLAQQPPFAISNSVNTSAALVLNLATAFTLTRPADVTNTFAVDPYYRTPYAQTWSLSVQRELGRGFFTEIGYLGTKGTRLDVMVAPGQGTGATPLVRNQLGNAVAFTYDESVGNSVMHSLNTRLQRRFRGGIAFGVQYTLAKSIDNSSTFGGAGNTVAQDWLNLAAERGLSSFDRRHAFSANWMWSTPWGSAKSSIAGDSVAGYLLKDWQVSGSVMAQTGTPLTARVLGNAAQLAQTGGVGSVRANATGQSIDSGSGFFNLNAFAAPAPGTLGNAGRNTIPGPGMVSVNLAVGRSHRIGESRKQVELRLEANNVLNHVNYTTFNTVVNSINYGLPSSAGMMRMLTALVRLRF